jgi:hypothetical protein
MRSTRRQRTKTRRFILSHSRVKSKSAHEKSYTGLIALRGAAPLPFFSFHMLSVSVAITTAIHLLSFLKQFLDVGILR